MSVGRTKSGVGIAALSFRSTISFDSKNFAGFCSPNVLVEGKARALGIITSVYAKWVPDAQMYANFLRFPMTFLSGTFVALATYPLALQVVARFLPLTYSIEALQNCISSSAVTNIYLIDIGALFVFTVIFLSIAVAVLKKRME